MVGLLKLEEAMDHPALWPSLAASTPVARGMGKRSRRLPGPLPGGNEYTRQVQRQISRKLRKRGLGANAVVAAASELGVSKAAVELCAAALKGGSKW